MVGDFEFAGMQRAFVAALDLRGAVAAVFGDREPEVVAVEGESAGVKPFAVLDLGVVDDDAGGAVDAVEVALFRLPVDGGDPEDIAFDIDALDVMEIALESDGLQKGDAAARRNMAFSTYSILWQRR